MPNEQEYGSAQQSATMSQGGSNLPCEISQVLEARASSPAALSKPCLVFLSEGGSKTLSSITYGQARKALSLHRVWIDRSLQQSFSRGSLRENTTTLEDVFSPSTVVAYISGNAPDFFLSVLACSHLSISTRNDCIPALLNTRWTPTEMMQVLRPHDPQKNEKTLILYGPSFRRTSHEVVKLLRQAGSDACCKPIPEFTSTSLIQDDSFSMGANSSCSVAQTQSVDPQLAIRHLSQMQQQTQQQNDDALILFTSGTTSGAKGVRLGHTALLIQAYAKLAPPCCYSSQTNMLASTLPFFHVGGLTSVLAIWLAGGTVLLRAKQYQGFDAKFVLQSLKTPASSSSSCNTLVVVPAMVHALQKIAPSVFPHVRLVLIGGQSASPSMLEFLHRHFPRARLVQTYACTEAASSLTFHDLSTPPSARSLSHGADIPVGDCVGKAPEHVELTLLSTEASGSERVSVRKPFQVGVIATRGNHLMNGYWRRPHSPPMNATLKKIKLVCHQ
mmetsp:Transcript_33468/g.69678  ORF Transcript_33468/g.69678 Transcript_33468/m.69678 type:complete len:501 (-) Transcript_33468:1560-3062(-)